VLRVESVVGRAVLLAIVTQPSMKSVGASGMGKGSQRSWFGGTAASSKRLTMRPLSIFWNGWSMAPGRMRYSQVRPVVGARRREGGARQLFGIQAVGHTLRRILVGG
jgi:hypothetical protein